MDDDDARRTLLVFVTVSASMHVGGEVLDPVREALTAAGFPGRLDEEGHPRFAAGWRVRVDQDSIVLQDPQGKNRLEVVAALDDPELRSWRTAVDQTEMLRASAETRPTSPLATSSPPKHRR